ncbi:hypothetical protein D3C71_1149030 [compost metagenome]
MSFVVQFSDSFPLADLERVGALLEPSDVFVSGYIAPEVGLYHVGAHLYSNHVEGNSTVMLPDRNIVSRVAKMADGFEVGRQERLVAGVLGFAQCLEIQIEPSIAYHELGPSQGNAAAYEELARFRLADSSEPRAWIDVALGRRSVIPYLGEPTAIADTRDLTRPLHRWRCNYIAALKMGQLELLSLSPVERAIAFFEWMRDDFILAGPAAVFACHYFAPSFPRRGLLKGLRSEQRQRALSGAANAAWDITHLSEFVRLANASHGTSDRYIFASLDEGLRKVARTLLLATVEASALSQFASALVAWWPKESALAIACSLFDTFQNARESSWFERHRDSSLEIPRLISTGEDCLRSWSPKSVRSAQLRPVEK